MDPGLRRGGGNGAGFAPELTADTQRAASLAETLRLARDRPVLALCPGAEYGPAKRWPARHFADLARSSVARGYRVWILGSPKDAEIGAEIAALADGQNTDGEGVPPEPIANLCGRTSLPDAVDLLSLATIVVSNDSGLMHVAGALGRPVVGIYGSSTAVMTPPLGPRSAVAEIELACRPCFERVCPLGHTNCLNQLMPDIVAGRAFTLADTLGHEEVRAGEPPYGATIVVYRRTDREPEFLVLQRVGHRTGSDWAWTPPSGSRHAGESIADCAARELREETGLELPLRAAQSDNSGWATFVCEAAGDPPVSLSAEHEGYEWVSRDEAIRRCVPEIVSAQIRSVAGGL